MQKQKPQIANQPASSNLKTSFFFTAWKIVRTDTLWSLPWILRSKAHPSFSVFQDCSFNFRKYKRIRKDAEGKTTKNFKSSKLEKNWKYQTETQRELYAFNAAKFLFQTWKSKQKTPSVLHCGPGETIFSLNLHRKSQATFWLTVWWK